MTKPAANRTRLALLILALALPWTFIAGYNMHPSTSLPHCQEDEQIQGVGNFTHGTWTTYECTHDAK